MFNIGFGELAIICIVLIIAVGPDRMPSMMKSLGKTMRTLRQASRDIRASTGIDELMRDDFDVYTPPRRPFVPPPAAGPAVVSRDEALIPLAPSLSEPNVPAAAHALEPVPLAPSLSALNATPDVAPIDSVVSGSQSASPTSDAHPVAPPSQPHPPATAIHADPAPSPAPSHTPSSAPSDIKPHGS
jgi:sec-independent protein translocase protein TatB